MDIDWQQVLVWVIVGGFAGTTAGRIVAMNKVGLGLWKNIFVGMIGAIIGGGIFKLLKIDLGLGRLNISFEELIAAFVGSFIVILVWWIVSKSKPKK